MVGAYLRSVVLGHVRDYGVPMNGSSIGASAKLSAGSGGGPCSPAARVIICRGSE